MIGVGWSKQFQFQFSIAFYESKYDAVKRILETYGDQITSLVISDSIRQTGSKNVSYDVVWYVLNFCANHPDAYVLDSNATISLLSYASMRSYLDIIECVIKISNRNRSDVERRTLFYFLSRCIIIASSTNQIRVVQMLISMDGTDPGVDNSEALHYACQYSGSAEIVKLLLEDERVDPTTQRCLAFSNACTYNYPNIIQLLLADSRIVQGLRLTDQNDTFRTVCIWGYCDTAIMLWQMSEAGSFESKIDPNYSDTLSDACSKGHISTVEFLLSLDKTDPSQDSNEALYQACKYDKPQIAQLLLDHPRLNLTDGKMQIIETLIDRNRISMLSMFLDSKAFTAYYQNIETKLDTHKVLRAALNTAIRACKPDTCQMLLDHSKAELSEQDLRAMRELALYCRYDKIVELINMQLIKKYRYVTYG